MLPVEHVHGKKKIEEVVVLFYYYDSYDSDE